MGVLVITIPGLCSPPYGFEARPGQPKVMSLSYMGWGLSMNFVPGVRN